MIAVNQYFYESNYYIAEGIIDNIKHDFLEKYKKNLTNAKKQLYEAGVELDLIEKIVKPHALAAAKELKSGNTKNLGNHFNQILQEMKKTRKIAQLGKSLFILVIVVAINSFFLSIASLIVGPQLAFAAVALFCAPLIEEAGKYFSIKHKATGMYFIVFNFVEFTSYLVQLLAAGIALPTIIIGRLLAVLLHYATTSIQFGARQKKDTKLGYKLAVLVHAFWNFMGILPTVLKQI
jgi:preprotein translocase subunit SecE